MPSWNIARRAISAFPAFPRSLVDPSRHRFDIELTLSTFYSLHRASPLIYRYKNIINYYM